MRPLAAALAFASTLALANVPEETIKWEALARTCDGSQQDIIRDVDEYAVYWRVPGGPWQYVDTVPARHPVYFDDEGNPIEPPRLYFSPARHGQMPPGTLVEYTVRARLDGKESCDGDVVLWLWPDLCTFSTRDEVRACFGVDP